MVDADPIPMLEPIPRTPESPINLCVYMKRRMRLDASTVKHLEIMPWDTFGDLRSVIVGMLGSEWTSPDNFFLLVQGEEIDHELYVLQHITDPAALSLAYKVLPLFVTCQQLYDTNEPIPPSQLKRIEISSFDYVETIRNHIIQRLPAQHQAHAKQ